MNIIDYIPKNGIILNFEAESKKGALEKLSRAAARLNGRKAEEIFQVLWAREQSGSTGLGQGVALPHGLSETFGQPMVLVAKSDRGVDFDSLDGLPAHIFILILSPKAPAFEGHLKILGIIGRLFHSRENIESFMAARDEQGIRDFLNEKGRG